MCELYYYLIDWDLILDEQSQVFDSINAMNLFIEWEPMKVMILKYVQLELE